MLPHHSVCRLVDVHFSCSLWRKALPAADSHFDGPTHNTCLTLVLFLDIDATPVVAVILGEIVGHYLNDFLAARLTRRNKGVFEPEMRLWSVFQCICCMIVDPANFFITQDTLCCIATLCYWLCPPWSCIWEKTSPVIISSFWSHSCEQNWNCFNHFGLCYISTAWSWFWAGGWLR